MKTKEEITAVVVKTIRDFGGVADSIDASTTFEDIGFDSLDRVELTMGLEDAFDMVPTGPDWWNEQRWKTVGDAVDEVSAKLGA